jgi:hypothetical protein
MSDIYIISISGFQAMTIQPAIVTAEEHVELTIAINILDQRGEFRRGGEGEPLHYAVL